MDSMKKKLTSLVATLAVVALVLIVTVLCTVTSAAADISTAASSPPIAVAGMSVDRCSACDIALVDSSGAMPGQTAAATSSAAPKAAADKTSQLKYNTITDRLDTLNRHPVLADNAGAHNASYSELMDFLKSDKTVQNKYDNPEYTCANFATDLQHNAESKGINCGYAGINFAGKDDGHAIDVFPTTDQGLIYVDITAGKTIISKNLQEGSKYYNMGTIAELSLYF